MSLFRSKGPVSTYKLTKGEMRYVLKVDPVDEVDSWTKVSANTRNIKII